MIYEYCRLQYPYFTVLQGSPYLLLPDCSIPLIVLQAGLSRLVARTVGPPVVTGTHLLASLALIVFIFCYIITVIF